MINLIRDAICCPGGKCIRPEDCDSGKRAVVVDVPRAAEAVTRLICQRWRAESTNVDVARWRAEPREWR